VKKVKVSKYVCAECEWCGPEADALTAPNPFDPDDIILGCPSCKGAQTLVGACEKDGCTYESSCGFPTTDGYMRTCGKHYRELNP